MSAKLKHYDNSKGGGGPQNMTIQSFRNMTFDDYGVSMWGLANTPNVMT